MLAHAGLSSVPVVCSSPIRDTQAALNKKQPVATIPQVEEPVQQSTKESASTNYESTFFKTPTSIKLSEQQLSPEDLPTTDLSSK